jgi:hypothetical protein
MSSEDRLAGLQVHCYGRRARSSHMGNGERTREPSRKWSLMRSCRRGARADRGDR